MTVAERRAREVDTLRAAGAAAVAELCAHARTEGVRFVLFGSFARGDIVGGSDLVVAGPHERRRAARAAAEAICGRYGLRPDVLLDDEVSEGLRLRLARDGVELG